VKRQHSGVSGCVLDGVDCVRRKLAAPILDRVASEVDIVTTRRITVADWQIFVHYADMLVDGDWFDFDVAESLREMYVGQTVIIALGLGTDDTTTARVRALLGHFDPSEASKESIRGAFGSDNRHQARAEKRFVNNLIHSSDDPEATRRDFGTWFGANSYELLNPHRSIAKTWFLA
jgi:nucleoside-diphosphate kinase